MKVVVKEFGVGLPLKTKYMMIEVTDKDNKNLGRLYINQTRLKWRKARKDEADDIEISLKEFIEYMEKK